MSVFNRTPCPVARNGQLTGCGAAYIFKAAQFDLSQYICFCNYGIHMVGRPESDPLFGIFLTGVTLTVYFQDRPCISIPYVPAWPGMVMYD